MRQKRNKPIVNAQFKTFNSQQSCIDVYSKVQSIFFEKFFKYNLTDYFYDTFTNVEEDLTFKNYKTKVLKQLATETFTVKSPFTVSAFQRNINQFYTSRSKCAQLAQISSVFKYLYSNTDGDCLIQQKDLIFVKVKIKAQIAKVQNLPVLFYKQLQICHNEMNDKKQHKAQGILAKLKAYDRLSINLFVVYYGDINFNVFNKKNYKRTKISLFEKEVDVKIHVFYISRIAMIDTFKHINKLQHLEYVNDLLIQLYEYKRQKIKNKRRKAVKSRKIPHVPSKKQIILKILKWFTFISIFGIAVGALILKFIIL